MEFKIKDKQVFFCLNKLDDYMSGHKGFIAGGAFKNLFNGEPVRDIDIFFETKEDFDGGVDHFKKHRDWGKSYENDNCISFYHKKDNTSIELVKRFFLSPQEVIEMFDFSIVRAAYFKQENEDGGINYKFMYVDRFFEDLHQKKLVIDIDFDKIPLPANTFDRAFKYQRYGYNLCRESKVKLIEALRALQGNIDFNRSLYFGID
jgi:hypothetical protein